MLFNGTMTLPSRRQDAPPLERARNGHNRPVPIILQPDPPPPAIVSIATAVIGTEARIALIRHFQQQPGPQRAAVEALTMPKQTASNNTRLLIEAGVIYGDPAPAGRRTGQWVVDTTRLRELLNALQDYTRG